MKVKSESEVAQSCLTLGPVDRSRPGSSVHGIFQARELEWGVIAFSELKDRKQLRCMVGGRENSRWREHLGKDAGEGETRRQEGLRVAG